MIDLQNANEWQHRDEGLGILKPWLVKSFLDELDTWYLKDKKIFQYGLGASTIWWSRKCKELNGVDSNGEFYNSVMDYLLKNGYGTAKFLGCTKEKEEYINSIIANDPYDIIIVDGDPVEWRDDCILAALNCLTKNGVLIIDNWMQYDVYLSSEEVQRLLSNYRCEEYKQEGHANWKTLVVHT